MQNQGRENLMGASLLLIQHGTTRIALVILLVTLSLSLVNRPVILLQPPVHQVYHDKERHSLLGESSSFINYALVYLARFDADARVTHSYISSKLNVGFDVAYFGDWVRCSSFNLGRHIVYRPL